MVGKIFVLLVMGGCAAVVASRVYPFDHCGEPGASACPNPESESAMGRIIEQKDACQNAGYLCNGIGAIALRPLLRWKLSRGRLIVRVPRPDHLPTEWVDAYRSAVIEGIMQWNGHPFRLDIDTSRIPTHRWDVAVLWTADMAEHLGTAGLARPEVKEEDDSLKTWELRVPSIAISTNYRSRPLGSAVALNYARRLGAHEMGHALGVGHSYDSGDIMGPPFGPAPHSRVSQNDLATVDALYRLPRGALVRY